ncbi:MAG: hypothetical protein A2X82_09020 [Geobacteraceae bacterium GWC2_55_20]|nr:MAG: hypothetical protein A2X82_09020 [Geobacteraceae bacterium GWC2_55_20]OGU26448.1 MAG: hypothetical protein A2X85_13645 [Geobacteraceae bacterium GWF2_54_21]
MINGILDQLSSAGSDVASMLAQEEGVLLSAIAKCGESLGKRYSYILEADLNPKGFSEEAWAKADVMVKFNKYHIAMSGRTKLLIKLIVYTKTKRGFSGNIAASGWTACREKVSLDDILETLLKELTSKRSQITNKTDSLLSQL